MHNVTVHLYPSGIPIRQHWVIERETILYNLGQIHRRMGVACRQAGRSPGNVRLLLATKTVPAEAIQIGLEAGETLLGENKVQEAQRKFDLLRAAGAEWHFIGHLQTNKVKDVLRFATLVQSVDRLELAQKLDGRLQFEGRSLDVLVQVNTSYEESKFGIAPEKALSFVREVARYDTLRIKGLMTIGLLSVEGEKVRKCFRLLRNLRDQIAREGVPGVEMRELSMGMSGDLEIAIQEGATIVRVGTAIFGERRYPDSYYWNESEAVR